MKENAFVVWGEHPEPWSIEHDLLQEISCALNIKDNEQHPFVATLEDDESGSTSARTREEANRKRRPARGGWGTWHKPVTTADHRIGDRSTGIFLGLQGMSDNGSFAK
jgi:hypothetical protein